MSICIKPNHPNDISGIHPKKTKNQDVYFQSLWLRDFPWLHYVRKLKGVVCFVCSKGDQIKLLEHVGKLTWHLSLLVLEIGRRAHIDLATITTPKFIE